MSELTTDQALGFIADGLCDCMGTLEEHHTNGCPQDNNAASWLAQVQRDAKVEVLRDVVQGFDSNSDNALPIGGSDYLVGYWDGVRASAGSLRAQATYMEAEK